MLHTGSGLVVLGQEQDQRGGGYSPQESFVGHMTLVNIWGEQLSAARVHHLYTLCERYVGSVRAWPDFKASVRGQITVSKDRKETDILYVLVYTGKCKHIYICP